MSQKKDIQIAKSLFRKSLTGSLIDTKKVSLILKVLVGRKPHHLVNILRIYKRLLNGAISKEEIVVESALKLENQKQLEKELIQKSSARRVIFKVNPKITAGVKITHGDWIYDASLNAKLAQLLTNI